MRATMGMIVAMGVLAVGLAGCTDRPLSAMDTYWLSGNTHPHLVWQDGEVRYQD